MVMFHFTLLDLHSNERGRGLMIEIRKKKIGYKTEERKGHV